MKIKLVGDKAAFAILNMPLNMGVFPRGLVVKHELSSAMVAIPLTPNRKPRKINGSVRRISASEITF